MHPNTLNVQIPVLPHVKKWLEEKSFLRSGYKLTKNDPIGIVLINLLETKRSARAASLPVRHNPAKCINVNLGGKVTYRTRCIITKRHAEYFNKFIEDMMLNELFSIIDHVRSKHKEDVQEIIWDFQVRYEFEEEEMTFERLKKAYYRYCKRPKTIDAAA